MNRPAEPGPATGIEGGLTEALRRAASATQVYLQREVLGGDRLTWTQYCAMRILMLRGEMPTLTLGTHLGVAKSTAVAVAVGLERQGLIVRTSPMSDQRKVLLRPSVDGLSAVARLAPLVVAGERRLATLPEFVTLFAAVLERVDTLLADSGGEPA